MKYFSTIGSAEELKKQYWELAKQHHPDRPTGNVQVMQEINAEYELALTRKNILSGNGAADFKFEKDDLENFLNDIKGSDVLEAAIKIGIALSVGYGIFSIYNRRK